MAFKQKMKSWKYNQYTCTHSDVTLKTESGKLVKVKRGETAFASVGDNFTKVRYDGFSEKFQRI